MASGFCDQGTELRLVLREGLVQEFLAGAVDGDGVMVGLTDVDTDEHVDVVVLGIMSPPGLVRAGMMLACPAASELGIHVTPSLPWSRATSSGPYQRSSDAYRDPVTTPPDHQRLGAIVMPGPTGQQPRTRRGSGLRTR